MNKFLKTREQIKEWLISMNITNFIINEDLTVDVDYYVNLLNKKLEFIPVKFNNIEGYFDCSGNKLTSLEGCPETIGGDFSCANNNLTSLEGCPKTVDGDFYCSENNLTSLECCPKKINGYFDCSNNKLTSLEYFPDCIGDKIFIDDMSNIYEDFEENFDTIKKIQNRILVEKERNNLNSIIKTTTTEKRKNKI